MNEEKLVEVATMQEIAAGKMKHIEVDGKEIAIANINGKYYAFDERCGHTGARLSMGAINGNIVTCPLHGAQFDCTTGNKVRGPNATEYHQRKDFLMFGRNTWRGSITSCLLSRHNDQKAHMM